MFNVVPHTRTIYEEQCVFVNTNAYLKYGGYGARNGMKPLARAIPIITLKLKRVHGKHSDRMLKCVECTLKESL